MIWPALVLIAAWSLGGTPDVACPAPSVWAADPFVASYTETYGVAPGAYAFWGAREFVRLGPYVCGGMVLLAADPANRTGLAPIGSAVETREQFAAFVFMHELGHLASAHFDEHAADCYSLAQLPGTLARMGVPLRRARRFVAAAQRFHAVEPPPYAGPCT